MSSDSHEKTKQKKTSKHMKQMNVVFLKIQGLLPNFSSNIKQI